MVSSCTVDGMTPTDPPPFDVSAAPAPLPPRKTVTRRVLAAVSAAALVLGLIVGGGAGVALGTTVFGATTSSDQLPPGDRPDFGDGPPPGMGASPETTAPPSTSDNTSTDASS